MSILTTAIAAGAGAVFLLGVRAWRLESLPDGSGRMHRRSPPFGGMARLRERLDWLELRFAALPAAECDDDLDLALAEGERTARRFHGGHPRTPDPGADATVLERTMSAASAGGGRSWSMAPIAQAAASRLDGGSRDALDMIGRRFHEHLRAAGLPLYRFTVSVPLDPAPRRVAGPRGGPGVRDSSPVPVEIQYREFDYLPRPEDALAGEPVAGRSGTLLEEMRVSAYRELGRRHWPVLAALLGRTLGELRAEGRVRARSDRGRPIWRVAAALEDATTAVAG